MTIPVDVAKVRLNYPGDTAPLGLSGPGGPLYFQSPAHLVVKLVTAAGAVVPLAYGGDYNITGDGGAGTANIVLTSAKPAGIITVRRATPRLQQAQWNEGDGNPSARFESTSDTGRLIDQEAGEALSRSLSAPDTDPPQDMTLEPLPVRQGKVPVFDASGRLIASTKTADQLNGYLDSAEQIASVASVIAALIAGAAITAFSLSIPVSVSAGLAAADATAAAVGGELVLDKNVVLDGDVILTAKAVRGAGGIITLGDHDLTFNGSFLGDSRQHFAATGAGAVHFSMANQGAVDIKWAGAKGDYATDDTAAINAVIGWAQELTQVNAGVGAYPWERGVRVEFPRGRYLVSGSIASALGNMMFVGHGAGTEIYSSNPDAPIIKLDGFGTVLQDMKLSYIAALAGEGKGGTLAAFGDLADHPDAVLVDSLYLAHGRVMGIEGIVSHTPLRQKPDNIGVTGATGIGDSSNAFYSNLIADCFFNHFYGRAIDIEPSANTGNTGSIFIRCHFNPQSYYGAGPHVAVSGPAIRIWNTHEVLFNQCNLEGFDGTLVDIGTQTNIVFEGLHCEGDYFYAPDSYVFQLHGDSSIIFRLTQLNNSAGYPANHTWDEIWGVPIEDKPAAAAGKFINLIGFFGDNNRVKFERFIHLNSSWTQTRLASTAGANRANCAIEIAADCDFSNIEVAVAGDPSDGKPIIKTLYGINVGNYVQNAGDPTGAVVPRFFGDELYDTTNKDFYKAVGTTNADWKKLT